MTGGRQRRRVIVVGSGIAGLTAALHAAPQHDVILVTGGALDAGNTAWAQGGIAGVLGANGPRRSVDSIATHIADTLAAGAGLCDEDAVRVLCSEAPERLRELIARGVPFDRANGTHDGDFARALEAAHSAPRVLHAGGDATGRAIERVLVEAARTQVAEIHENTRLLDLVVRDGAVVGVVLAGPTGSTSYPADAVVLATGGFAGLYSHSSNPPSATGSGIAVASRAGAVLADLEFVQFHPSVLAAPGGFLVSEAVRGEGAVLRNERGERFMLSVHRDAELAPRDVVARAIALEMRRQGGRPVVLDATSLGGSTLDARFPSIARRVREAGYDWTSVPIPVTPAAHYTMGGIATDLDGRTSVPGLFAVGEVARTGVHGANRLASNSLIEGAVFGARIARALSLGDRDPFVVDPSAVARVAVPPSTPPHEESTQGESTRGESPAITHRSPAFDRSLGDLLWDEVGLVRSETGLRHAADGVVALADAGGDRDALTVAALVAHAAALRRESRGAHARSDYPATDDALAHPQFLRADIGSDGTTMGDTDVWNNAAPGNTAATREPIAC